MSIVSLPFLSVFVFLAIAYFIVPKKLQPYFLLCINIVFYCYAGLTQLLYLCLTILSTYLAARIMETKPQRVKKAILIVTITLNIMILFLVKYLNYIWEICANLNILPEKGVSALIVPLGIAFYTLQAIGYCIDIYRQKYKAESNFLKYALFMSYFPIIMQGPISRFNQLGEQLVQPHSFQYERIKFGIQLMAWGFFKKLVIADRANILVNQVYGNYLEYAGFEIFIASLTYTIQIYTDFSGCVDICRGISQILGIELIQNFDHPYFSRSITEFWRRWHISLSSWLRDYLYIPLGGNRKGVVRKYLNIIVVFFISGIWHGVGFHFILWGLIHGFYQVFGALTKGIRNKAYQCLKVNKSAFSYKLGQVGITFLLVNFAWIFFRGNGIIAALKMIKSMVFHINPWIFTDGSLLEMGWNMADWLVMIAAILVLLIVSILQRKYNLREKIANQNLWFRWVLYLSSIFAIIVFGIYGPGFDASSFIYMQF